MESPTQRPSQKRSFHHHYHSPWKRGLFSLLLVGFMLLMGTFGFHWIEKLSYLDSFYSISMIATGQGLPQIPSTAAGKVFASLMAFFSVGTVVTSLGFLLGPFLGKLWKVGIDKLEQEAHLLKEEYGKGKKDG